MMVENALTLLLIELLQLSPLFIMMAAVSFRQDIKPFKYDGYLKSLLEELSLIPKKYNSSVVIIVDGKSGLGKTTLCLQLAYWFNKAKVYIYYNPKNFLEGLSHAKAGDFFLFDESMLVSNRSSLSEMNRAIIIAMSMIRSKCITVAFACNSIWDLDRNLVLSRADLLLHCYGSAASRGRFAAFFKSSGDKIDRLKLLYLNGRKLYDYNHPKANFYGRFPKQFLIDEAQYERDKQKAINEFLRSDGAKNMGKMESKYKKLAARVLLLGQKDYGMTWIDIADKLNDDKKKLSNIVCWARDEGHLKDLEGEKT